MRQSLRNLYPCILQQERRQRPKPSKHQQPQYVENWQLVVALILSRTRDEDFPRERQRCKQYTLRAPHMFFVCASSARGARQEVRQTLACPVSRFFTKYHENADN